MKWSKYFVTLSVIGVLIFIGNSGIAMAEQVYRGEMIFSHEVRTFRGCADDKVFWVHVEKKITPGLHDIFNKIRDLSETPDRAYAPVYVELKGEELSEMDKINIGEFAKDYDGVLAAKSFQGIYALSENACKPANRLDNRISSLARTYVLECDDQGSMVFRVEQNSAWIFGATKTVKLGSVPGEKPGNMAAWIDEKNKIRIEIDAKNQVNVKVDGQKLVCNNDFRSTVWEHAKLNGVSFRGVGNEPGWYLEIYTAEKLVLVSNYGQRRIVEPYTQPIISQSDRTTTWKSGALNIMVSGIECTDNMNGDVFESTVIVESDEKQHHGCGKALH